MELFGFTVETLCFGFVLISVTSCWGKQNVPLKYFYSIFHPKSPQQLPNTRATGRALVRAFKPPTYNKIRLQNRLKSFPPAEHFHASFQSEALATCGIEHDFRIVGRRVILRSMVARLEALSGPAKISKVECPWHQKVSTNINQICLFTIPWCSDSTCDHLSNAEAVHDIVTCRDIVVPHCTSPLQGIVPFWLVEHSSEHLGACFRPVSTRIDRGNEALIEQGAVWLDGGPCKI